MTKNEKRLQSENDRLRTEVAMLRARIEEAMRYLVVLGVPWSALKQDANHDRE